MTELVDTPSGEMRRATIFAPHNQPALDALRGLASLAVLVTHVSFQTAAFQEGTLGAVAARLGVPVLLLDIAFGPLPPDYRFRWLHEARGFSLGDIAGRSGAPRELGSMARRIAELRADSQGLGERSLAHFAENHSLPSIAARIIEKARVTRCQWGDLTASGLLQHGAAYTLFRSIRKAFSRT